MNKIIVKILDAICSLKYITWLPLVMEVHQRVRRTWADRQVTTEELVDLVEFILKETGNDDIVVVGGELGVAKPAGPEPAEPINPDSPNSRERPFK